MERDPRNKRKIISVVSQRPVRKIFHEKQRAIYVEGR